MSDDVLDQVSLGYQLYWNAQREPAAVGLAIGTHGVPLTDGPTLLAALQSLWPSKALPLQLAVSSAALLSSLLDYAQPGSPGLILDESQLRDPSMARRVHQAHQRGLALLWRGAPGARPPSALAPCFSGVLLTLTAQEALAGLQASRLKPKAFEQAWSVSIRSAAPSGHLYADVASRRLVDLCLDELNACARGLHGDVEDRQGELSLTQLDPRRGGRAAEHEVQRAPVDPDRGEQVAGDCEHGRVVVDHEHRPRQPDADGGRLGFGEGQGGGHGCSIGCARALEQ
jgi:hypothetical protein